MEDVVYNTGVGLAAIAEGTVLTAYGLKKREEFREGFQEAYNTVAFSEEEFELERDGIPTWDEIGRYMGARKAKMEQ